MTRKDGRTDGGARFGTDGQMDGWTVGAVGLASLASGGRTDGRTNGRTDGRMDGRMDGGTKERRNEGTKEIPLNSCKFLEIPSNSFKFLEIPLNSFKFL